MKDLIIWGGTGNFKVLCEFLRGTFSIRGYFDQNTGVAPDYRGIPYLGDRDALDGWLHLRGGPDDLNFIVSIGPGFGAVRARIHDDLKRKGLQPIRAIHPSAFVAESVTIGEGTQVYAMATICVDAGIGDTCIVNTRASIDHECVIEDGATVGPGATLAGLVAVGKNADIYTGAVILPRLRIGEGAVVGAGAVVRHDVEPYTVVVGNPARVLKRITP